MYQIGVDVNRKLQASKDWQGIRHRMTELVFEAGITYCNISLSHLQSRNLAVSLGYYPTWIELYAR